MKRWKWKKQPAERTHLKNWNPRLTSHFLETFCEQAGYPSKEFAPSAVTILRQHAWPGNVRELQHAVERAFILSGDELQVRLAHFNLLNAGVSLREI